MSAKPYFVRCIKSNERRSPKEFDARIVLEQLKYSGVFQAIQIMKGGYPQKKSHADFFRDYWFVVKSGSALRKATENAKERSQLLVRALKDIHPIFEPMQVGHTLVLYKGEAHRALLVLGQECRYQAILNAQRAYRGFRR